MQLPPGLIAPDKDGKFVLPNILLCFRSVKSAEGKKDKDKTEGGGEKKKYKKRSKSRELRCGILYIGCECERRNGLQDQCPRTGCQGARECMELPPTCAPSEFAQAKHMHKHYEQSRKAREDFINRNKRGGGGGGDQGSAKKGSEKADYDCFPLDQLIADGMPCPICDKLIEGCHDKKGDKPKDHGVGPIIIDFPVDCCCC